jgi:hypothetical protein
VKITVILRLLKYLAAAIRAGLLSTPQIATSGRKSIPLSMASSGQINVSVRRIAQSKKEKGLSYEAAVFNLAKGDLVYVARLPVTSFQNGPKRCYLRKN